MCLFCLYITLLSVIISISWYKNFRQWLFSFFFFTLTWWNICSISGVEEFGPSRNWKIVPSSFCNKFGPGSNLSFKAGADLMGGIHGRPLPQGFDPMRTQWVPLCFIFGYLLLVTDHNIFLNGVARAKKTLLSTQNLKFLQKVPKKRDQNFYAEI